MPVRPFGTVPPPPFRETPPELTHWLQHLADAFNALPFSYFSTADGPNASAVTAPSGFIGLEIGSSATTKVWVKTSTGTTGWKALG